RRSRSARRWRRSSSPTTTPRLRSRSYSGNGSASRSPFDGEASLREERDMTRTDVVVNEPNQWRLATPGHTGWARTARPGDPRKYFMVSADCHANEPHD